MPIRSEYTIEQFEEAFQRFAHSIPKFRKVVCEDFTITFDYDEEGKPRRIAFGFHKKTGKKDKWGYEEVEYWGFEIEKRLYATSPHATKIDFGPYPGVEAKVKEFIRQVMGDTKPEPRFSLTKYARRRRAKNEKAKVH